MEDYGSELHNAAGRGDVGLMEKILKKGKLTVDHKAGQKNQTPLHAACFEGKFESAYFLITNGANVNATDVENWLPLHCAALNRHLKICALLLTRGSQINKPNDQLTSPIHYIIRSEYTEELIQVLGSMIEHQVDLECKNKVNETPLLQAASKGMTESVRFLIDHNANVNASNNFGQTALHFAVENGNVATVLLLLKNGADMNKSAEKVGTPFEIAQKEGKTEILKIMEEKNFDGSTYTAFYKKDNNAPQVFVRAENTKFISKEESESHLDPGQKERSETTALSRNSSGSFSSKSEGTTKIVNSFPGFRAEYGTPDLVPKSSDLKLLYEPPHYYNWFYHSDHFNYVGKINKKGTTDKWEPIIISTLMETRCIRINMLSRLGSMQMFHPILSKKALVIGTKELPKEIIETIKKRIMETRPKDNELKMELELVQDVSIRKSLLEFESYDPLRPKGFSIGVLYSKQGQTTESEQFGNEHGSTGFDDFIKRTLGDRIELKNWLGYRGDLDLKENTTGVYSIYRRWKGFELMFHVSTLLPYATEDINQQLARKRRIGNDIGVIVYQEGGTYTPPIRSQFLHTYTVVSPIQNDKETEYAINLSCIDTVPKFGPELPTTTFKSGKDFRNFLLTKVVNSLLSSLQAPSLRESLWAKPTQRYLTELVTKFAKNKSILHGMQQQ